MNAPRGLPVSNVAPYPTGPSPRAARPLRILFLVSAHNGLSQRTLVALTELGHAVTVAVVNSGAAMDAAVRRHDPELIVCPMLKTIIPDTVLRTHRCLVVHPGPRGPRAVLARLGDRTRDDRMGRDSPRGDRRGRRRCGVVHTHIPHPPGGQEQPLPPRGPARRDRGRHRRRDGDRRRRTRATGPWRPARDRPAAPVDPPGRPRDRLERRSDGDRDPPRPRRRGSPGCARHR